MRIPLEVLLREAVFRTGRAVLRRSFPAMSEHPRFAPIARLAAAYVLAAVALVVLLPVIAGAAVYAAAGPMGHRRPPKRAA